MGHQRLGKLAATKAWRDIVSLIAEGNVSVDTLADAVLDACDKSFALAKDDPAFREAMFLLCKIPMAACEENLSEGLRKIGLDGRSSTQVLPKVSTSMCASNCLGMIW